MLLIHCFNKPSVRFIDVLVNTLLPLVSLNLFLCNRIFMLFFWFFVMLGLSGAEVYMILFCFLYKQQVLVEFGLNKKVLVVRGDNSSLQAFEIDGEIRMSER